VSTPFYERVGKIKTNKAMALSESCDPRKSTANRLEGNPNTPPASARKHATPPEELTQDDRNDTGNPEAFDLRLAGLLKIRKDNVRAVEILVGFSPSEAARLTKGEQDRYFSDAKAWLV